MRIVEVGQYFVTRNAGEFQHTVACREYTLPRDDKASQPKGDPRNYENWARFGSHNQFSKRQT